MSKTLNLLSNAMSERTGKYSQIFLKETLKERPALNSKGSSQISNTIIYSALVFLLLSNVVFFLLFYGYKSETKRISLNLTSVEKLIEGNSAEVDKFLKEFKRIEIDFKSINERIKDYEETVHFIDRNGKANAADIGKLNKEMNGLTIRFDALLNEIEKLKTGGK
jgi:septal ring factor EnvC (AmiA/AmiB activator)